MNPETTIQVAAIFESATAQHVTIERYAVLSGETAKAVRGRIESGVWIEGRQYHRRHGRIFIDLKGVARWVEGQAA